MTARGATLRDHRHGVVTNKCTHPDCIAAWTRWSKRYKLDKVRGIPRTVPGERARIIIAGLEGAGWSRRSIAAAAGVSATAVSRIMHGQPTVRIPIIRALEAIDPDQVPSKPSRRTSEPFVPRRGAQRRIQALMTLGWTHAEMERRSGVRTCVLANQQGRWVLRSTHDKLAALYRELCAVPGPSEATRRRARRRGYPGPLDWHDIDLDPAPVLDEEQDEDDVVDENVILRFLAGDEVATTRAERFVIVERFVELGRPLAELERLGWKPERYRRGEEQVA